VGDIFGTLQWISSEYQLLARNSAEFMRDRRACCFIALITLFLLLAAERIQAQTADAQTGGTSLSGMVKDASGMAVAFAKVSAKNRATGATTDVQAEASGLFEFPNLAPGDYEVGHRAYAIAGASSIWKHSRRSRRGIRLTNCALQ